ncbi:MAG: SgcJ/EcaC family oxidoreductase [Moraxellaceae bacterium]|nr:SgcJ/EcaC family oxidoreductase [Moraxellaceae bacterium]MDZ4386323.1 SgcJ/EcaC family oxidoreductase [Moraxellaceae bacterium]
MNRNEMEQIEQFIAVLEAALNAHDAVEYNRHFDEDISWGNPNGGLLRGLQALHSVHKSFLDGPLHESKFRYTMERAQKISSDAAYVHVRLTRTNSGGTVVESDERCLYVITREQGSWRLCAGHNTRIQPGQNAR